MPSWISAFLDYFRTTFPIVFPEPQIRLQVALFTNILSQLLVVTDFGRPSWIVFVSTHFSRRGLVTFKFSTQN